MNEFTKTKMHFALALLGHGPANALELVTALEQVNRHADGLALVGEGAGHRLADPPRRVGREAVAAAPVELLDRADQAELPLLHEVVHVEPLAHEAAGVGDHLAGVRDVGSDVRAEPLRVVAAQVDLIRPAVDLEPHRLACLGGIQIIDQVDMNLPGHIRPPGAWYV